MQQSNTATIVTLPESSWEDYRNIRLEALQKEPAAYTSTYQENADKPPQYWMDRLQEASEQKTQWLYFAQYNNSIIGMAGAFTLEGIIHVIAVYVQEEHRGKGIAYALMSTLLDSIQTSQPTATIEVEVNADQVPAHKLYLKLGFTEVSREERALGDNTKHEVIRLRK